MLPANMAEKLKQSLLKKQDEIGISSTIKAFISSNKYSESFISSFSWHPLGFLFTYLNPISDPLTLRLHLWPENYYLRKSKLFIHNHYYDIISFILSGDLTNLNYELSEKLPHTHSVFEGGYNHDKSNRFLKKTEKSVRATLLSKHHYSTGNFYEIKKSDFHDTKILDESFAATIVLTFNKEQEVQSPIVLGNFEEAETLFFRKKPTDRKEVLEILATLMSRI